ncbi:hypothetical protein BZG36_04476 [Bifiguratus adelaidae]|uniref:Rhamnolipids biosynthesis 3-oxoacyl-[acyl-carrier-protein] reductase n=1 Tax=Bifiguratus adelaidae TaxID=1938954 RepID=A0A261XVI3_9FUNG|nr:hypothetical protein BZG36_04476 [Bifiguratus adelaidae]
MAMDMKQLFSVKNKVVLITGGSRGIGEMMATGFVESGAKVYISSRQAKACDEVAKRLTQKGPGNCIPIPADLQKYEDCEKLLKELAKHEDHLDVLINNAGATWGATVEDYPEAAFQKVMDLNVKRVFTVTQLALPLLSAKSTHEQPSVVINIGSIAGLTTPSHGTYAYSASKAAVHQLTKHLATHLADKHILVNAIAPGSFPSKMMKETLEKFGDVIVDRVPVHRVGTPEDIAGTALYLSSRAGHYTNA